MKKEKLVKEKQKKKLVSIDTEGVGMPVEMPKAPKQSKALVKIGEKSTDVTMQMCIDFLRVFHTGNSLTPEETEQFVKMAMMYQLNPFKREIYAIPFMKNQKNLQTGNWEKVRQLSLITGFEVYLKRAERSGMLNGWKTWVEGEGENMRAKIVIYRKDWSHPFEHEVKMSEYRQENKMWNEKGETMLRKVAMAQGFRLAFPVELGGMPYTADELPDNMTSHKIEDKTQETPKIEAPKDVPTEKPVISLEEAAIKIKATSTLEGLDNVRRMLNGYKWTEKQIPIIAELLAKHKQGIITLGLEGPK